MTLEGAEPDLRAAVVVPEDRPVVAPGLRLAESAPLAHAYTVPPAAAGEHEGRAAAASARSARPPPRGGGEKGESE